MRKIGPEYSAMLERDRVIWKPKAKLKRRAVPYLEVLLRLITRRKPTK